MKSAGDGTPPKGFGRKRALVYEFDPQRYTLKALNNLVPPHHKQPKVRRQIKQYPWWAWLAAWTYLGGSLLYLYHFLIIQHLLH